MILRTAMENSDHLGLSGKQLQVLTTIYQAGSLSLAAKMLGMNQSTLSYWLDQLRSRFGDALFVRVGQGVQPTERMDRILGPATEILERLSAIVEPDGYDPGTDNGTIRLACTAIERDLIVHPLIKAAIEDAPRVKFEITEPGSSYQVSASLREGKLDFAFYPSVLDRGDDLTQRALYPVNDAVFYDPAYPLEEGDIAAYCARPHARVSLGPDADFELDRRLAKQRLSRSVGLQASSFEAICRLVEGTPLVATLPLMMSRCGFCKLVWIPAPLPNSRLDVVLLWHARHRGSDRHRFWRERIFSIAAQLAKETG